MSNALGWIALVLAVGIGAYALSVDSNVRQLRAKVEAVEKDQQTQQDQMIAFKSETQDEFEKAQTAINGQLDQMTAQANQHSAKIAEAVERIDQPGIIASALLNDETQKNALVDALWSTHGVDWVGSEIMVQQVAQEVANRYSILAPVEAAPIDAEALARAIATSPDFAGLVASLLSVDD